MQYFIHSFSSLNNVFSIFENGNEITFKFKHIYEDMGDLSDISSEDLILGYQRGINIIKYIFKVKDVDLEEDKIILEKVFESNNGVLIDDSDLFEKLQRQEIVKISENDFLEFYTNLLNNIDIKINTNIQRELIVEKNIDLGFKKGISYIINNAYFLNSLEIPWKKESNPLYTYVEYCFPRIIDKIINNNNYLVIGSGGSGHRPQALSFSILNRHITTSTYNGVYVSYYFEKDLKCFYLALSIGGAQGRRSQLRQAAEHFKEFITNSDLTYLEDINFDEELDLVIEGIPSPTTKKFLDGYVICKKYDLVNQDIPSDYDLIYDLNIFLKLYDFIKKNYDGEYSYLLNKSPFEETIEEEYIDLIIDEDKLESLRISSGENLLYYGVPGSGKSNKIKTEKCKDVDEYRMERIVFHQDYTYSDFIGQILPKASNDQVRYEFIPGPFTSILKKAYKNPSQDFYLIIEEINRGNAPAIFGDIFQLLDRMDEEKKPFKIGTSEFAITNSDIAYIVYGDKEHKVRIPSNLSIIATMNTSDQNVFTLDTAFQRRWDMELIENKIDDEENTLFNDKSILDTGVTWKDFCMAINKIIIEENNDMSSSEDKRLGTYFVKEEDFVINVDKEDMRYTKLLEKKSKKFSEKILKYLWDDAFKLSRNKVFNTKDYGSLDLIIKEFNKDTNSGKNRFKVFNETTLGKLNIEFDTNQGGE